jgi:glucosamine-6-phosphate deaminase
LRLGLEVTSAGQWLDLVAAKLTDFMSARPRARLCLATGNTTRSVYSSVTVTGSPTLFLLDEFGGLSADDPARCSAMLRRDLPGVPFLAPDVDARDPIQAAREYGSLIDTGGIDLAVVGLGRNGHIGMNEPGSTLGSRTRVVQLAESTASGAMTYGASIRPTWGITVGIAELMESAELWMVVTGPHKAEILGRVMRSHPRPELPATFLHEHPHARVLADTDAAARL